MQTPSLQETVLANSVWVVVRAASDGVATDVACFTAALLGDGDSNGIGVDIETDETDRLRHGSAPLVALRGRDTR